MFSLWLSYYIVINLSLVFTIYRGICCLSERETFRYSVLNLYFDLMRDSFKKTAMIKNMADISWPVVPSMCQVLKLLDSSLNPPSSIDDTAQLFSWDDYYYPSWVNWWTAPLNKLCHQKHLVPQRCYSSISFRPQQWISEALVEKEGNWLIFLLKPHPFFILSSMVLLGLSTR